MRTPGLGLALGGGAVLGAAHLGVLQAMEARGLRPEFVAGTSAGALVGAAYAAGLGLEAIEEMMLQARWTDVGRMTPTRRLGLLDSSALERTVAGCGVEGPIETLPVRFAAVTTDLLTRDLVALTSGPLGRALRASIAVPGLFPPIADDGRLLIDGGLVANLPIAPVRSLGARWVIAVRVRPEWEYLPIARTAHEIARLEAQPGTIVIRPKVRGLSMWTTTDVPRLIRAGREAADEVLSEIQSVESLDDHAMVVRFTGQAA